MTLISPVVSVPVLTVQITVALPRLSTEGRERTTAFRFAMRARPRARLTVTTAGRLSGIAATARDTADRNSSRTSADRDRPMRKL